MLVMIKDVEDKIIFFQIYKELIQSDNLTFHCRSELPKVKQDWISTIISL